MSKSKSKSIAKAAKSAMAYWPYAVGVAVLAAIAYGMYRLYAFMVDEGKSVSEAIASATKPLTDTYHSVTSAPAVAEQAVSDTAHSLYDTASDYAESAYEWVTG